MQSFIKELGRYREILPKNTIKTLRGQALSGNIAGARKGLDRIKAEMHGGDNSYADCSCKLKKR
jgi:hypothetical protein